MSESSTPQEPPAEAPDYYLERGRVVFTAEHHLRRGWCCGSGCRHCPYDAATRAEAETRRGA